MGFFYPSGYDPRPHPELDPRHGQPTPEVTLSMKPVADRIDPASNATNRKDLTKASETSHDRIQVMVHAAKKSQEAVAKSAYTRRVVDLNLADGLMILGGAVAVAVLAQLLS